MLRNKKATAFHQSPEIRILPSIWVLLDFISIRYQRLHKTSGGPKFGSEASISSYSELHLLDITS